VPLSGPPRESAASQRRPQQAPHSSSPACAAAASPDAWAEYAALRYERIAVEAYYLAEGRGFAPGAELDDWLTAEAQVEARWREFQPKNLGEHSP
jgi:hypothetical protein